MWIVSTYVWNASNQIVGYVFKYSADFSKYLSTVNCKILFLLLMVSWEKQSIWDSHRIFLQLATDTQWWTVLISSVASWKFFIKPYILCLLKFLVCVRNKRRWCCMFKVDMMRCDVKWWNVIFWLSAQHSDRIEDNNTLNVQPSFHS